MPASSGSGCGIHELTDCVVEPRAALPGGAAPEPRPPYTLSTLPTQSIQVLALIACSISHEVVTILGPPLNSSSNSIQWRQQEAEASLSAALADARARHAEAAAALEKERAAHASAGARVDELTAQVALVERTLAGRTEALQRAERALAEAQVRAKPLYTSLWNM